MKCKSFEQILFCVLVLQGFYSMFLSFVALRIRATRSAPFQFESGS